MPDSSTIQEFLVSIGFKTDDAGRARFDAALASNKQRAAELDATLAQVGKQLGLLGDQLLKISDRPTREATDAADRIAKRHAQLSRNVKQLGFEAVATTGAFVTGFTEIAKQYDNLYYMAQRAGVSTAKLSAQQFAGSQVGGLDIAGMQAAVTQATQTNPGIANFFGSSNLDEVINKIQVMSHGQTYLIAAFAQMAGLSYQQVMQYLRNQPAIKQAEEEHLARLRQAGIETDKVFGDTAQGKIGETGKIVRSLNTLWDSLDIAMVKGFDEAYPAAQKLLDVMNNLASANLTLIKNNPGTALKETIAAAYVTVMGALGAVKGIFGIGPGAAGMARALPPLAIGQSLGVLGMGINPFPSHAGSPEEAADSWKKGSWQPPPGYVSPAQQALSWLKAHAPSFAEGGVVPATVHAGEIVLPQSLSSMLLQVASSGSGGGGGLLSTFTESFRSWLGGSTSYHPVVQVLGLDVNALNSIAYGDSATREGTGGAPAAGRAGGAPALPSGRGGINAAPTGQGISSPLGRHSGVPSGAAPPMSAALDKAMEEAGIPPEARGLLSTVSGHEATSFNQLANYYKKVYFDENTPDKPGYYHFPQWGGFMGQGGLSHGAGMFQFEPGTWKGVADKYGLTNFRDPRQQVMAAEYLLHDLYANDTGGHDLEADLKSHHVDPRGFTSQASRSTWAALANGSWRTALRSGGSGASGGGNSHTELTHNPSVTIHSSGDTRDIEMRVLAALNTHSGRFLRNARAAIT